MGDGSNELVAKMIAHGVRAGALRAGARAYPDAAKGLTKAAEFHSAKVAAFADTLAGAVGAALPRT